MTSEAQTTSISKRQHLPGEFFSQPKWTATMSMVAYIIHALDRGDEPDSAGRVGCYASLEAIAANIQNVELRTISRALAQLKDCGALVNIGRDLSRGLVYRRINLQWDVRERIFARRKISEIVNGQRVTRRLKKSEIPAPKPYDVSCQGRAVTSDNRNENVWGIRKNPVVPFRDEKIISDSKPNPGNEASPRFAEASPVRAPYTRRDKVLALTEVVALLKDHYPVEKQNEKALGMFWRRWNKGTINLRTLAMALEAKDMLYDSEDQVREVNDFYHFIRKFDELVSKSVSDLRVSAKSKLREALRSLGYPESRPQLEDGEPLSDEDYGVVCQWTEDELHMMLRGSAEMQDHERLGEIVHVTSFNLLRRKFAEMRTCLSQAEEVEV